MAELAASYTHFLPLRRQVLLLHGKTLQVRLLSDPLECLGADSGWHGRHNWFPGCDSFSVWDFAYEGSPRPIVPHVAFVLHDFSTRFGIWRYAVHELGGAGIGPPFADPHRPFPWMFPCWRMNCGQLKSPNPRMGLTPPSRPALGRSTLPLDLLWGGRTLPRRRLTRLLSEWLLVPGCPAVALNALP